MRQSFNFRSVEKCNCPLRFVCLARRELTISFIDIRFRNMKISVMGRRLEWVTGVAVYQQYNDTNVAIPAIWRYQQYNDTSNMTIPMWRYQQYDDTSITNVEVPLWYLNPGSDLYSLIVQERERHSESQYISRNRLPRRLKPASVLHVSLNPQSYS